MRPFAVAGFCAERNRPDQLGQIGLTLRFQAGRGPDAIFYRSILALPFSLKPLNRQPKGLTSNCGRAGGHSMMKKLLLLALIAVAREATAEDAKCVREHAAMIETIRAYARSDAGSSVSGIRSRTQMLPGRVNTELARYWDSLIMAVDATGFRRSSHRFS
jgi:hypothetical protein